MEFGYFTLSDNHYENNRRSANQFVAGKGAHPRQHYSLVSRFVVAGGEFNKRVGDSVAASNLN